MVFLFLAMKVAFNHVKLKELILPSELKTYLYFFNSHEQKGPLKEYCAFQRNHKLAQFSNNDFHNF